MKKENTLIAEFMGLCPLSRSGFISDKNQEYYGSLSELRYHKSWDWLMPVMEKCLIIDGEHYKLNDALLTCNIEEVHQSVVEFINEQNK